MVLSPFYFTSSDISSVAGSPETVSRVTNCSRQSALVEHGAVYCDETANIQTIEVTGL